MKKLIGVVIALLIAVQTFGATVVSKVFIGPDTDNPNFITWRNAVLASMMNGSYPVQDAALPTSVQCAGSNWLQPQWLVASSSSAPSWQGVFPPPSSFAGSTGTCLWLFVRVEGQALSLPSITGASSSLDGLLNSTHSFSNFSSGVLGVDSSGGVINAGSGSVPMKKLFFGIKLKSFLASDQSAANQITGYVNGHSDYNVMMAVGGLDGSTQWSTGKTLNTKVFPVALDESFPQKGLHVETLIEGFRIKSPLWSGIIATVEMRDELDPTHQWVSLGAYEQGEVFFPPATMAANSKKFARLKFHQADTVIMSAMAMPGQAPFIPQVRNTGKNTTE